jgi:hypothetical protein
MNALATEEFARIVAAAAGWAVRRGDARRMQSIAQSDFDRRRRWTEVEVEALTDRLVARQASLSWRKA